MKPSLNRPWCRKIILQQGRMDLRLVECPSLTSRLTAPVFSLQRRAAQALRNRLRLLGRRLLQELQMIAGKSWGDPS